MVGAGKGSWEMRGQQLGAAVGARVTSQPTETDWQWADLCVLVKNYGARFAAQAQQADVPIVWDALDFWSQPRENQADAARARALVEAQIRVIKPALTIGATQAMAEACRGAYLPHHSWAGLAPSPARQVVSRVAYEGNPTYLGAWAKVLGKACAARGWTFAVNPAFLGEADILVALRDGPWDGWLCREWKSGVKLVNAIAAGRPVITQPSAAVHELESAYGSVVESVKDLDAALDYWTSWEWRTRVVEQCEALAPRYALDRIAADYRRILESVETLMPC